MTMTVVRCPYCVSDDEFRQMIARSDGRFVCNKCGHSAIPDDKDFKCSCWKRASSYGHSTSADAGSKTRFRLLRKLG